jgi:hypothetical protein
LLTASRLASALFPSAALLVAAALFLALFIFVAIALLAALLSGSGRFGRFVRIPFCFHNNFLWFTNWSFALREETLAYFEIVFEKPFGLENLTVKRQHRTR